MNSDTMPMPDSVPMIDCQTAANMLWDYLDGGLKPADRMAIEQHVKMCAHCFPSAQFGQVVLNAIARVREARPEAASLRQSVLTLLRSEGYTGP